MKHLAWAWEKCGLPLTTALLGASLLAGCSSGRDVKVTGEVTAPASVAVQGKIHVDFMDLADSENPEVAQTAELDQLGAFEETVSLEGDKVLVRAINDTDGNGACTEGEAWAEAEVEIADDDTATVPALTLSNAACPSAGSGG